MKRENFSMAFLMANYENDKVMSKLVTNQKVTHKKKMSYKEYNASNKNNKGGKR